MKSDYFSAEELADIGFRSVGQGVRLSRHTLCFAPERISIGDCARIDAFCILSAGQDGIRIGRYVHIGAYSAILGGALVELGDFAGLSARCTIFSSSEDFSGAAIAIPTVPDDCRGVVTAPVILAPHALLGAGCVVLPGVTIGESACAGAASLVTRSVAAFDRVAGTPARVIGRRLAGHRELAAGILAAAERLREDGAKETPDP